MRRITHQPITSSATSRALLPQTLSAASLSSSNASSISMLVTTSFAVIVGSTADKLLKLSQSRSWVSSQDKKARPSFPSPSKMQEVRDRAEDGKTHRNNGACSTMGRAYRLTKRWGYVYCCRRGDVLSAFAKSSVVLTKRRNVRLRTSLTHKR